MQIQAPVRGLAFHQGSPVSTRMPSAPHFRFRSRAAWDEGSRLGTLHPSEDVF